MTPKYNKIYICTAFNFKNDIYMLENAEKYAVSLGRAFKSPVCSSVFIYAVCVYRCIYVCTHEQEIEGFPGVQYHSKKKSKFSYIANLALNLRIPKLPGRTVPEFWTFVELITSRLRSCKIRIALKNIKPTPTGYLGDMRYRDVSFIYLQH